MNEKQAKNKGYGFSGIYGHDKEEIKARAKEERMKGNKAVMVTDIGQRDTGYSVYFIESEANVEARKIAILERKIKARAKRIEGLKLDMAKDIADQIDECKELESKLKVFKGISELIK